ncbi:hypothetical protein Fmac_019192 [Flemingia macrophylla]|uniref:Uncharacterized protein n=1 Tax=Flemingia macrophylla TaxID=520843 RepID=A0ABD1M755_9FABA
MFISSDLLTRWSFEDFSEKETNLLENLFFKRTMILIEKNKRLVMNSRSNHWPYHKYVNSYEDH